MNTKPTPRTDALIKDAVENSENTFSMIKVASTGLEKLARTLERELSAANEHIQRMQKLATPREATEQYNKMLISELSAEREKVDKLESDKRELVGALDDLLTEVESLDDYSLTRDTESYKAQACWDYANDNARTILAKHKEPK